jgi:hypothetical protein
LNTSPHIESTFIMNRNLIAIALAAATTLGATASFAGDFPASGEFSAVDQQTVTGPTLSREQVRQALKTDGRAQPTVNGEDPESYAAAPAGRTRQEVRQEGRMALRAGKLPAGDQAM